MFVSLVTSEMQKEISYSRASAIIVELEVAARSSDTSPGPVAEFSKTHVDQDDADQQRLVKSNRRVWALRLFMLFVVPL